MRAFDAILFDCDGVLIDSEPLGCEALSRAITAAGLPMTRAEASAVFSGHAAADSLAWLSARGMDAGPVFAESDRLLFDMFAEHVPHMPGIEAILGGFDLAMAVCSNSSARRLRESLQRTPLAARFGAHIYSADHVARPKPAPDMALLACANMGIAPERAIFIDDNIHGMRCAKAAGCLAVGFIGPSDHRPGQEQILRHAGADHIVRGMADLHALLAALSLPLAA